MKKRNPNNTATIVKNGEVTTPSEIAEFRGHALTMQTGTRAEADAAFRKIYDRYKEWLKFIILRNLNLNAETAEDLLQDVFVKVYRNINSYSAEFALSTWLHKIAVNAIIDHKRKTNVELLSIESLQTDYGSSNDENAGEALFQIKDEDADTHKAYAKAERKELVHKAISTVISSEKEKIVVNLFFMQGLSQEEIHVETKMPIGTIKALVFRAKDKLKNFLEVQSPELLTMDRTYNRRMRLSREIN